MFNRAIVVPDRSQRGVSEILDKSYPDFVAFLGQHNTPPGGFRTIDEWIRMSNIDRFSHILDLACSTGYSGRTTHELTGASVLGIDISADAVTQARVFAGDNSLLEYVTADAGDLPVANNTFSHVLGGCNFGFIQERNQALTSVHRTLKPGGLLCTSSFYYRENPPLAVIDRVEAAIDFRPDGGRDRNFWITFFSQKFELVNEVLHPTPPFGPRRIERATRRSIYGGTPALEGESREVRDACFHRLKETRLTLDEHRTYQALMVAVWRAKE